PYRDDPAAGEAAGGDFAASEAAATDRNPAGTASGGPSAADSGFPQARSPQGDSAGRFPEHDFQGRSGPEGTGRPGDDSLEGAQTPQLTIEKTPPKTMQVGKPATFNVRVRNTGSVAAGDVEVFDQVPSGTKLVGTTPRATRGAQGELVWAIGTLQPGDEETVSMQVMPSEEGELGSVATVRFDAAASAKVTATRAKLVVKTSAPSRRLVGQPLVLTIELSNPGSGPATGVTLAERVPPGMSHPAGADLEYEIGTLAPGESRTLELEMLAGRPGPVENVLVVRGDGKLRAEHRTQWEVIAPALEVNVDGSHRRFLERQAVYELAVSNPGTAPAHQVQLVAHLPEGLKYVSANNAGHYDESTRAVSWRLKELPVRESGTVELVTMPVQPGQYELHVEGAARGEVETSRRHPVQIEGVAAIMYEVRDVTDPIEVGGETLYEIRVLNQGSKASSNVRLAVDIPPEMEMVAAEGPTRHAVSGQQVVFDGLARLAPKADTTYRVRVRGVQPGDLRVRVQLLTNEMRGVPVTKEESTRVYSDR
ncbi:MAG: CARDB domain-containing protein, partial [Pirellulales bacterium]